MDGGAGPRSTGSRGQIGVTSQHDRVLAMREMNLDVGLQHHLLAYDGGAAARRATAASWLTTFRFEADLKT
jgi:hypothetical protein